MKIDGWDYDGAIDLLRSVNRTIGLGPTLTVEEKHALDVLWRIQEYIYTRIERGDEVFQSELGRAGKSTLECPECGEYGRYHRCPAKD